MNETMHDDDAEQYVLGSALFAPERAVPAVLDILRDTDYYAERHRLVHRAIANLAAGRRPIDAVTVCDLLGKHTLNDGRTALEAAGGRSYIFTLVEHARVAHVEVHARIVRDHARRRSIVAAALDVQRAAQSGADPDALLAELDERAAAIAAGTARSVDRVRDLARVAREWADEVAEDARTGGGMRTGWRTIDESLGVWLRPGEVVGLAARTAVGKTWACLHLAAHATATNDRAGVLCVSLEMPATDILERVALHTLDEVEPRFIEVNGFRVLAGEWLRENRRDETNASRILRRFVSETGASDMYDHLVALRPYLTRWRIVEGGASIADIPRLVAESRRQGNPTSVVIVDYLGLLRWDGRKTASTYERVSETARALKEIAIRERVVLLVACQLNRGNGAGEDRPSLAMLRDSGAVEEAMDRIVALWNPSADNPDSSRPRHVRQACLLKNRKGPIGEVATLNFTFGQRLVEVDLVEVER